MTRSIGPNNPVGCVCVCVCVCGVCARVCVRGWVRACERERNILLLSHCEFSWISKKFGLYVLQSCVTTQNVRTIEQILRTNFAKITGNNVAWSADVSYHLSSKPG